MKFMIEKVLEVAKTNQVPTPQTDTLSLEAESQFLTGEVLRVVFVCARARVVCHDLTRMCVPLQPLTNQDEIDVYGKPRKEESSCCPI
jgi:hypothetical protein